MWWCGGGWWCALHCPPLNFTFWVHDTYTRDEEMFAVSNPVQLSLQTEPFPIRKGVKETRNKACLHNQVKVMLEDTDVLIFALALRQSWKDSEFFIPSQFL